MKNSTTEKDNEEEFEAINNVKVSDVELKSIKEWLERPKYDENEEHKNNQYNFVLCNVDSFFKCVVPKRSIQPTLAEEEEEDEEGE